MSRLFFATTIEHNQLKPATDRPNTTMDRHRLTILLLLPLFIGIGAVQHPQRRVWITATQIGERQHKRFCTNVATHTLTNREQLRQHVEQKLSKRLRLDFACIKIKTLTRSTVKSKTNTDLFVQLKWYPIVCERTRPKVVSVDATNKSRPHVRNDSKEQIELQSSQRRQQQLLDQSQHFLSMEEVNQQLQSLEAEIVELKIEPFQEHYFLQWLASNFIIGFVTTIAATSVFVWLMAYRNELCSSDDSSSSSSSNNNQETAKNTGKRRTINGGPAHGTVAPLREDHSTQSPPSKRARGGNKERQRTYRPGRNKTKKEASPRSNASKKKEKKKSSRRNRFQVQTQNNRVQEAVSRLQELLAEAGPWGTTKDKSTGYVVITCQQKTLSLERSLELASYTQDSADEEEEQF